MNENSLVYNRESFDFSDHQSNRPKRNHVVSRMRNGAALSLYADDFWDFSSYSTSIRPKPCFNFNLVSKQNREDIKWFLFCLDRLSTSGRNGFLSVGTLVSFYALLKSIDKFCVDRKYNFKSWFESEEKILEYVIEHKLKQYPSRLGALYFNLLPHRDILGFNLVYTNAIRSKVRISASLNQWFSNQHPIIPSRILFGILSYSSKALEEFNSISTQFEEFCITLPLSERHKTHYKTWFLKSVDEYCTRVKSNSIKFYFEGVEILTKPDLNAHISHLDYCARNLILGYSGMRDAEVMSLNYDCLQTIKKPDGRVLRLAGFTSKLTGARAPEMWVTSEYVMPALCYLKSLARVSYEKIKVKGYRSDQIKSLDDMPLFCKFFHTTSRQKKINESIGVRKSSFGRNMFISKVPKEFLTDITLNPQDVEELYRFDPTRDWRVEGFSEGNKWALTTHQFRRSLAVYSLQSGLITLPALRAQLKHLSEDMAHYYRNNALEAKRIFNVGEDHFAVEMDNTRAEAEWYIFIFSALLSHEELMGSMGKYYEYSKPENQDSVVRLYDNRDKTINEIKKGELAWVESSLGGCTSLNVCTKKFLNPISACFTCEFAVIKVSALERAIQLQKRFVESLDSNTIAFRTENSELKGLEEMLIRYK